MNKIDASPTDTMTSWLVRFAPGLPALLGYRHADSPHDLFAGLSVAAAPSLKARTPIRTAES